MPSAVKGRYAGRSSTVTPTKEEREWHRCGSPAERRTAAAVRGGYKFAYVNKKGKRTTGYGCTDLEATWQIARKLESDAKLKRAGLIDAREEGYAQAERRPLLEHVGDWAAVLEARKVGEKHARQMRQCVERIINSAALARLSQLGADVVQQTVSSLATVQKPPAHPATDEPAGAPTKQAKAKGLATLNRYIVAAKAFSAWLARSKRVREDALNSFTNTTPRPTANSPGGRSRWTRWTD